MKTRILTILAAALFTLTACTGGGGSGDNPATTTITETTPAPTTEDMTETVIDLSWAQQTEADKDSMCLGLTLNGPEWASDQMQQGAGDTAGIDWDEAAVLVAAKCALR